MYKKMSEETFVYFCPFPKIYNVYYLQKPKYLNYCKIETATNFSLEREYFQ